MEHDLVCLAEEGQLHGKDGAEGGAAEEPITGETSLRQCPSEDNLDDLVAKYLLLQDSSPPPHRHDGPPLERPREHPLESPDDDRHAGQPRTGTGDGWPKANGWGQPGWYWVGRSTPYYPGPMATGGGTDPAGVVPAMAHVRVAEVNDAGGWWVEVQTGPYARVLVYCTVSDAAEAGWCRLS